MEQAKKKRLGVMAGKAVMRKQQWHDEFEKLIEICTDCGLTEEKKWGTPCFTYKGSNIAIINPFKNYVALGFFKGALLKDRKALLQTAGQVQSARLIKFNNVSEIEELELILKAYIHEAIEVEKAGLKVPLKKTEDFPVPEELENKFTKDPKFKKAFYALTPGRQRGYLYHFAQPKQSKTREARIEKFVESIMNGKGFQE